MVGCSPHTGQVGTRAFSTSLNVIAPPSYCSSRSYSGRPAPVSTLMASSAWIEPMRPGMGPRTPASEQLITPAGGGGSGNRQR
jgi:hypothetical protein